MPEPVSMTVAALLMAGIAVFAVLSFWKQILGWAIDSLGPWIKHNLPPSVAEVVNEAFVNISEAVAAIRRRIKAAWEKLREFLLKQTIVLKEKTSSKWVAQVTSWLIENPLQPQTVKKREVEIDVSIEDLPKEVLAELMRRQKKRFEKDVTEIRDREIEEMELTD